MTPSSTPLSAVRVISMTPSSLMLTFLTVSLANAKGGLTPASALLAGKPSWFRRYCATACLIYAIDAIASLMARVCAATSEAPTLRGSAPPAAMLALMIAIAAAAPIQRFVVFMANLRCRYVVNVFARKQHQQF